MTAEASRGRFLTFEGIDGAGKSTHVEPLAEHLRRRGLTVLVTREPGGTDLADGLRHWLLTREMSPRTETLLAFAARSDHVDRVIRPALAAGQWVLCDRFNDSTFAYQGGGRELGHEAIAWLARWTLQDLAPDRTYWFALDPVIAARRRQAARTADRFEREREAFFRRVDRAYADLAAAEPLRIRRVDASLEPAAILALIEADIDAWMSGNHG